MTDKEETRSNFHKFVMPKLIWKKPLTEKDRNIFLEWKQEFKPNMNILNFYKDKRVLFQIVKALGNKELCFDMKIRWCYASKIDNFLKYVFFYKLLEQPKTIYKGLAGFSQREAPPFGIQEKKDWQENIWIGGERKFDKCVNSYDFAIDLDADTFEESYKDAKKLFDFFNKFKIKFMVQCSGKKGFHFLIEYSEFKDLVKPFNIEYCVEFCRELMFDIKSYLKLKKVDIVIYSPTRYIKCPFTIDKRNGRVIYPLNDEEFLDFKKNSEKYMSVDYILSKKDLGFIDIFQGRKSNPKGFYNMVSFLEKEL